MIALDSSALVAVLFGEPDRARFEAAILADADCIKSAINAHETATVVRMRSGTHLVTAFWLFVVRAHIEIVPFDLHQVHAATEAFGRYGKGIHSKAKLNLCDCAAYALAKTRNVPLLFKGDDFPHTDIVPAV